MILSVILSKSTHLFKQFLVFFAFTLRTFCVSPFCLSEQMLFYSPLLPHVYPRASICFIN